ncbi:dynein heavy chain 11, axonemal-like [Trichechus manatus latirostris]|uniref:Dynein heavy chain 11, axonemal-like n=1 Tax=Trichechus manatus latirostris TaxID=127582 RepID=A0A2Y9R0Z4_TRIMA|nr:dynein heavy chain 11, axonemal-like [Trichechus manatus latirostris]
MRGGLPTQCRRRSAPEEAACSWSPRACPMAAPVAAREARGFQEAPILRLTPGASLEAAGVMEFEEEEEDEEETRKARSFVQDARVRFLGGRLEQMLRLPEEKWSQYLESQGNRQDLGEFLESANSACLLFSTAASGRLAVSREVRGDGLGDSATPPAQQNAKSIRASFVSAERSLGHLQRNFA